MENLTNKDKYLVVKNSILKGKIEENEFLKSFMDTVALQIIKGYSLTKKQIDILNLEVQRIMRYISEEDKLLIQELDKEALNIDVERFLFPDSSEEEKNQRAYEAMLKIREMKNSKT